jgi:hypothetical protein
MAVWLISQKFELAESIMADWRVSILKKCTNGHYYLQRAAQVNPNRSLSIIVSSGQEGPKERKGRFSGPIVILDLYFFKTANVTKLKTI